MPVTQLAPDRWQEANPAGAAASPWHGSASDEQLARAAAGGDVAAFEGLYERHHRALLAFSRHMLGRVHDAEDVVQHTFLAADRAFRGGKVPRSVRAWLYTVARNRCVSLLRARREDAGLPAGDLPATENLAAEVEQRDDLRHLLADLRTLPDDQRAALVLAELGDLSHAEVAKVIGVRPAKVKALVFQAREALMAFASARAIPCRSIREELAVARGPELRRRHLRDHVARCEGCREFAGGVRRQRAALAVVLPVVPTVALRDTVLAGLGSSAGGAAAAGAGFVAVKSTAGKLLTIAAIGGAAGGGTVAVKQVERERGADRAPAVRAAEASPSGGAPTAGATVPIAAGKAPAGLKGRGASPATTTGRGYPTAEPKTGATAGARAPKAARPGTQKAKAKAPGATAPYAATPKSEAPASQAPHSEPKADAPTEAQAPYSESKADAPKAKAPTGKPPDASTPKVKAPDAKPPKPAPAKPTTPASNAPAAPGSAAPRSRAPTPAPPASDPPAAPGANAPKAKAPTPAAPPAGSTAPNPAGPPPDAPAAPDSASGQRPAVPGSKEPKA